MSDLIVPVAIWNGAPSHTATAVLTTSAGAVFTGATSGELCLWDVPTPSEPSSSSSTASTTPTKPTAASARPALLLVGHDSEVVALGLASTRRDGVVVSLSRNGQLRFWGATDGRALGDCSELSASGVLSGAAALCMAVLPGQASVAVAGGAQCVYIVDVATRRATSAFRAHGDWVTCLASPRDADTLRGATAALASASKDGTIALWPAPRAEHGLLEVIPLARASVSELVPSKESTRVLALCFSFDASLLVVVTAARWTLVTAGGAVGNSGLLKSLLSVRPPLPELLDSRSSVAESEWAGGCFVDSKTFLAWTQAGIGCIYAIDTQMLLRGGLSPASALEEQQAAAMLVYCMEPPHIALGSASPNAAWKGSCMSRVFSFANGSTIAVWELPDDIRPAPSSPLSASPLSASTDRLPWADASAISAMSVLASPSAPLRPFGGLASPGFGPASFGSSSFGTGSASKPDTLRPSAVGSFSKAWSGVEADRSSVSCCCLLEDIAVLICGHENGEVSTAILPTDPFPKRFKAHEKRVSAVLAPNPSVSDTWRFLVTAGDDYCIKVWELFSFELHHSFCYHSGPISRLLPLNAPPMPPGQADTAAALHHSFIQHWLSGHPAPICEVRWKVEQDLLMVSCADTSLCVWELSSGRLTSVLSGVKATDTLKNYCMKVFSNTKSFQAMPPAEDLGITSSMVTLGNGPSSTPVEIILLNMRKILAQLSSVPAPSQARKRFSWTGSRTTAGVTSGRTGSVSGGPVHESRAIEFRFPPFSCLSYLIPWAVDAQTDGICRRELFLKPPTPFATLGSQGEGSSSGMSLILPSIGTEKAASWRRSSHFTATASLAAVALCKTLTQHGENRTAFGQLLALYCTVLPENVVEYVEPSLSYLSLFWSDLAPMAVTTQGPAQVTGTSEFAHSARMLIASTLSRMDRDFLRDYASVWRRYLIPGATPATAAEGMADRPLAVKILAIICCEKPDALDRDFMRLIASELVKLLLLDSNPHTSTAADLFAKGFATWRTLLEDPKLPLQRLFALSLEKPRHPADAKAAQKALFAIGFFEPPLFLAMVHGEIIERRNQTAALAAIGKFIHKWNPSLVNHLAFIVEATLKALDPASPAIRDRCIKAATGVIQRLVQNFPMTAFSQESQRLAVGMYGSAVIYDIKTGNPVLSCQTPGCVFAAAFSPTGRSLAVYTSDGKVSVWYLAGFLSHIKVLMNAKSPDFQYQLPKPELAPRAPSEEVRLLWPAPGSISLRFSNTDQPITFATDKTI